MSPETGLVTYERTISFDTIKADQLFNKTMGWFVEYFRNADNVIRGENKPGLIKGTYLTDYSVHGSLNQPIDCDILVRIKDGAIKVIINNFVTHPPTKVQSIESLVFKKDGSMKTGFGGVYEKLYKDIESNCISLTENLKASIVKKTDW